MHEGKDPHTEPKTVDSGSLSVVSQFILYAIFAVIMVFLNMGIQNLHQLWWIPLFTEQWGHISFFQQTYLNITGINIPELVGSIIAVGVTYITKFFLDKFFVFRSTGTSKTQTRNQFFIYLSMAILTTLENLGIQLLLGVITPWNLNIRIIIALTCGYTTKFFLDRRFSFQKRRE